MSTAPTAPRPATPRILIVQHEAQAHPDLAGRRLRAAGITPEFAG